MRLQLGYAALGLDPERVVLEIPEIPGFQQGQNFTLDQPIPVPAGAGWLLLLRERA